MIDDRGELRRVERNVVRSDQRFYPRHLPTLLHPFLAGDEIAEPLERWP
jgi:hypothetical protein